MRHLANAAVLAGVILWSVPARGDSAAPCTVWAREEAGRASICPSMPSRTCPDEGLLRRNVDTGEIVLITTCDTPDHANCFLDECVPAGSYEYGLRTPYACCSSGSYYFDRVTTEGAPASCTRTLPAPVPASSVPWSNEQQICESTYGQRSILGCSSAGAVLGLDGLLAALGLAALLRRRRR